MPKNTLIILGVLVAVLPFLGLPGVWKTPLYFLMGIGIAVVAYQQQYRKKFHFSRAAPRRSRGALNQTHGEQIEPSVSETESSEQPITREDIPTKNP